MLTYVKGDILQTQAQTLVNPVNTAGMAGAGLDFYLKRKFPEMFAEYNRACCAGELKIGNLLLYKGSQPWILCFPTKKEFSEPSRYDYLEVGLNYLVAHYQNLGITSLALPALGCGFGGLEWKQVDQLFYRCLRFLEIPIEIHPPAETLSAKWAGPQGRI